jgi:putative transposase
MPQTYCKLWIYLIWSTKDREPLIVKEICQSIFEHIRDKAKRERIHLDSINGTADHVHCLVSISPRIPISELSNKLKGESSH